jgi:hypothetical protein
VLLSNRGEKVRCIRTPFADAVADAESTYRTEPDNMPELKAGRTNFFQEPVGVLLVR